MDRFWTKARTEKLKIDHASGMSASLVADNIGGGCTRNAVIGKVHRLKLPAPGHKLTVRRGRKPTAAARVLQVVPVIPLPLQQLGQHTCRWPLWGDARPSVSEQLFCSAYAGGVEERRPYCEKHSKKARSLIHVRR